MEKMTTLGEITNYIKIVSKHMEEQESTSEEILQMVDRVNAQFGVKLSKLSRKSILGSK